MNYLAVSILDGTVEQVRIFLVNLVGIIIQVG
jgi:hypothetical protein